MSGTAALPSPIALDGRLQAVAELVRAGARVADVGCDHGLLICALMLSGKIKGGIACDLREGPLAKARAHVEEYQLGQWIEVRLCDGLFGVDGQTVDDVMIAGMGGELIFSIIQNAPWLQDPAKRLILQPMSREGELRAALYGAGFELLRERGALAAGRLYPVMLAAYTGEKRRLTEAQRLCGRLPEAGDDCSRALLRARARHLRKIADSLGQSHNQAEAHKWRRLAAELEQREREGTPL